MGNPIAICSECGCEFNRIQDVDFHDCTGKALSTLREQIAREIPELIVELKAYWNEQSMFDGFDYITDENFERILNFVAAAIARGEE